MTEENYNYRTSQVMLRNQFPGSGKFQIPIIPKFQSKPGDFDDLLLIGFDKTRIDDQTHLDRMVHFFLYDYKFERAWKNPDADIEKLSRYRAVLSPDFSMYLEMAPVMQLYNTFRNRWCGAYLASKGIRVIPTVNWGDESSFDFCFEGIEKGSVVAVSTYMASEHDHRKDQKEWFMAGYTEMLRRIEPEKIICYNTPFPEMTGDIVAVDYDLSSWRYMNQKQITTNTLDCYKIGDTFSQNCDTLNPYMIGKGGGSVYGGEWKPAKPADERFLGNPGEIKILYKKDGTKYETKIGSDGRAIMERHYTVHSPNNLHSNPHDHTINWNHPRHGHPNLEPAINYWNGDIPEFKNYNGVTMTNSILYDTSTPEDNRFKTISDFKESMLCGGEAIFRWNGTEYGVFRIDDHRGVYCISPSNGAQMKWYDTLDALLQHMIDSDRLRDVITQVTVIDRTI